MKKTLFTIATIVLASALSFAQTNKTQVVPSADKKVSPTPVAPAQTDPAKPENPNQGDFKFEEMEFNFGTIKQGESVSHDFNFVNTGKEPIIINSAQGSCG